MIKIQFYQIMRAWAAILISFLLTNVGYCYSNLEAFEYALFISSKYSNKTSDDFINVNDFGIIGDSITDQSERIQELLHKYDRIFFPPGNYLVGKSLKLKDNQIIQGSSHTTFISQKIPQDFSFFTINSKKNIMIRDLNFRSDDIPGHSVTAVLATHVSHLTIKRVNTYNCGIVETWIDRKHNYKTIPADVHSDVFYKLSNSFIEVDSCYGIGSEKSLAERTVGVLLYYASDWKITNSTFSRYKHGIQWWGGDSHPDRNGDTTNVRKCRNGLVSNVTVSHIREGGIWGSMGENIIVKNCKVSNCGDVGIDFEGCFNSQALDNEVKNCKNGCIATFHYNKNILFKNNRLVQKNPAHPLACIYNSAQKQDNGKIVFSDNTFIATEKIGIIKQRGPSNHIEFLNNSLHNVVVNFSFNNNRYVLIKNNRINITQDVGAYSFIIKAGQTNNKGVLEIEKNQIINTAQQKNDLYALHASQSDYNSSPINRISENNITGIPNKIKIEWAGANSGVTCKTYINSNQLISASSIKKVDSGKSSSVLYINGKKQK